MQIKEFQKLIEDIYFEKDSGRGVEKSFLWFVEEVGELAEAVRKHDAAALKNEFADVLAWLSTIASILEIDLEEAALEKYRNGCPRCGKTPCTCVE